MRTNKYTLTCEQIKKLLHYNPSTGVFTRITPARGIAVGDIAGSTERDGYVRVRIYPFHYPAHRLAWVYMNGEWPDKEIDHIDGNRSNNAIHNLRLATRSENKQNTKKAPKGSKSGLLGARATKDGKFVSGIMVNGVVRHLGTFSTAIDAHHAYMNAKRELHPFAVFS